GYCGRCEGVSSAALQPHKRLLSWLADQHSQNTMKPFSGEGYSIQYSGVELVFQNRRFAGEATLVDRWRPTHSTQSVGQENPQRSVEPAAKSQIILELLHE